MLRRLACTAEPPLVPGFLLAYLRRLAAVPTGVEHEQGYRLIEGKRLASLIYLRKGC